jgi:membrane protein required for colicin V production
MNIIDLICILPLGFAVFNGFRKGLVIELATLAAFLIAILACLSLTHSLLILVKPYTGDSKWVPFVCYLFIFVAAYVLVLWIGKLIEKVVQIVQLGLVNRLLGMLFSLVKVCFFISLVFWMADLVHLIPSDAKEHSYTWQALHSFAADTIRYISNHIPFVKGEIEQIEKYFDHVR